MNRESRAPYHAGRSAAKTPSPACGRRWREAPDEGGATSLTPALSRPFDKLRVWAGEGVRFGEANFRHAPHRSAAVRTGASHKALASSSRIDTVIEAPAMSIEVT